jgi:hypothetical protein
MKAFMPCLNEDKVRLYHWVEEANGLSKKSWRFSQHDLTRVS